MLSTTLASIGDGVIVTDAQGAVTFVNAEAERLTGWKSAEAQGQPLPGVFHIITENTRQPVENPVQQVLRHGNVVGLANHTLLVARDGHEIPIDDSAAPIRQQDGQLFGVVLVFRDFSEYRNAQQLQAQAKEELEQHVVERTAKLNEMISELQHVSYAITHDMRAPLRAMNSFATILMEECADGIKPAQAADYCRRIIAGATRLDKLITDALNYTNAIHLELPMQPVDLFPLIRGILDTYPNLHPDKADIRIEGELPNVIGNESLLTQCFSNLLGNAVKFVADGVRPTVRIRAAAANGFARIRIEDNGIGIPKNVQYRLFGMFQKLDNKYEGTGMGLAIVRKVVKLMGGQIIAESEPGKGSVFTVELRPA
jgi:PAS domain S-box-containing protein